MLGENDVELRYYKIEIDRLIEEKTHWQYEDHPGMSKHDIQRELDRMDDEIRKAQKVYGELLEERKAILREERG